MASSPQHLRGMIVLAGGTGERLGGSSKPDLLIAGDRLISWTLSFLPPVPTVVVAPEEVEVPEKIFLTMEEPPGSGPAAGIVAGWHRLADSFVFSPSDIIGVCPVDAPLSGFALRQLSRQLQEMNEDGSGKEKILLGQVGEVTQYVLGAFTVRALMEMARSNPLNRSVRGLLGEIGFATREISPNYARDLDTPADIAPITELLRISR